MYSQKYSSAVPKKHLAHKKQQYAAQGTKVKYLFNDTVAGTQDKETVGSVVLAAGEFLWTDMAMVRSSPEEEVAGKVSLGLVVGNLPGA